MKKLAKDNKGITLVALIITIILMSILVTVSAYSGINTYRNMKVAEFIAQMQLIQSNVDNLVEKRNIDEFLTLGETTNSEQNNAISKAYSNHEITTSDTSKYRAFTKEKALEIFNVEDLKSDIMVNFETREVVSLQGIEYNGKTYYTQYKLPNGQTIVSSKANSRTVNFTMGSPIINGLNCNLKINNISISNGTLSYSEINSEKNPINWQIISNYTEKNKEYTVNISKSGNYILKLRDNVSGEEYSSEDPINITVTNSPKTNVNIENYNYSEGSSKWAYAQDEYNEEYVWIPRFAYKTDSETGSIDIKFIKGNSNIATDNTYIDDEWKVHEKFTNNGEELTGIWVSTNKQDGLDMVTLLQNNEKTLVEINI